MEEARELNRIPDFPLQLRKKQVRWAHILELWLIVLSAGLSSRSVLQRSHITSSSSLAVPVRRLQSVRQRPAVEFVGQSAQHVIAQRHFVP